MFHSRYAQIFQRFSDGKPSTIVVWVRSAVVVVVRSGGSEHIRNQLVKTHGRRDPWLGLAAMGLQTHLRDMGLQTHRREDFFSTHLFSRPALFFFSTHPVFSPSSFLFFSFFHSSFFAFQRLWFLMHTRAISSFYYINYGLISCSMY
jgi:hypothetical protein